MANPRYFPTIPDPVSEDVLLPTVLALKQAVELLTGQRGNAPAAQVYRSVDPPPQPGTNDIWVRTTDQRVYIWDGLQWLPLTT